MAPFLSVVSSRFFFRVCAFSISQTQLSRNQTGEKEYISVFKQTQTRVDGAFISIGEQSAELK